ncbi:MAG: Na+/H+ antiporter NhaC family protein [Desulfurococcaceae archaeon]
MPSSVQPWKLVVILLVLVIGFAAFAPPEAEFMPEEKRFTYVTFPLLPPLVAISLAMLTGQVLPSLFIGVWIGALMYVGYNPVSATLQTFNWLIENTIDSWNAKILLFDFIIGAFVGVLFASGALYDVADRLSRRVRSARSAGLATSLLGVIVFFDDYSNTVIVGNAMRPLADRTRVSRELLSYIIDSMAAPVAGIMLVSTWIGYEVGLIKESLDKLIEMEAEGKIPLAPAVREYPMWLSSLQFHFYSILAIALVFIVVLTRRHFGPMLKAEVRCYETGKVLRDGATPLMPTETVLGEVKPRRRASAWVFAASVLALVVVTMIGLWYTGGEAVAEIIAEETGEYVAWWQIGFADALMESDAAAALLWGSFAGYFVALIGVLAQRALSFREAMEYTVKGFYLMTYANAILLLAWSIKSATDAVGTADYVIAKTVGVIPVVLIPLLVFLVSMFISYTTGTSWGTFGVMMPIAVPLAWIATITQTGNATLAHIVTAASIGAVFGGGIYGDHVSPISDTTIMSSMFSGADHIDHVATQIPYGTLAAGVSIVLYLVMAATVSLYPFEYIGVPLLLLGIAILVIAHRLLNKWYARRTGLPEVVPDYVIEK